MVQELVSILGAGQMGLVLADAIAARGVRVRIWGPRPESVDELASTRRSPRRLPGFVLPESVEVTGSDSAALDGATVVINAIATQYMRSAWTRLGPPAGDEVPLVSVSKGIENGTLLPPTRIMAETLGDSAGTARPYCVLSGPTIAAELASHLPATMVAASNRPEAATMLQDLLDVEWLRVYRLDDTLGVELAGATKNVIAIAAGMIDGLEIGANAKSALLARGLAEIARLGVALGARVETFFGVAGVGDLATSCFSPQGRNRSCGERLGRGETLDSILESSSMVVEGVATTQSVVELAARHGVDMPITTAVHAILFGDLSPRDAIRVLMSREQKAERIG